MFENKETVLEDLMQCIEAGDVQLPEFQRDYVWSNQEAKRLVASIARGFPVGALLTIETGGKVEFATRPLEGTPKKGKSKVATELILDGQQRMTSLYMSMYSENPVNIGSTGSGARSEQRFYFIDILKALEDGDDFEDSIESVSISSKSKILDEEEQYKEHKFPLNKVFKFTGWHHNYLSYWNSKGVDGSKRISKFEDSVVKKILSYKMPIIKLHKNSSREEICLVFEKVNVGGKKLESFELLTAMYAAKKFNLRDDWSGKKGRKSIEGKRDKIVGAEKLAVLSNITATEFLQCCTLIDSITKRLSAEKIKGSTLPKISCSRASMLLLELEDYKRHGNQAVEGFLAARRFLANLKLIAHKNVPYAPTIVVIATTCALLGKKNVSAGVNQKLVKWYWNAVLTERYTRSSDTQIAADTYTLIRWVKSKSADVPEQIAQGEFIEARLDSMKRKSNDAFKAVNAVLHSKYTCRDFIKGIELSTMQYVDDSIDVHHIFPVNWCKKNRIDESEYDSIINKTSLFNETNRKLGDMAPAEYLELVERETGLSADEVDEILKSHLIDPIALRKNNFMAFHRERKRKLLDTIKKAISTKEF